MTLILGALAWSRISSSFLPLPSWLPVLVTLLSPLTAAALAVSNTSSRSGANANTPRTRVVSIIDQLHSILLSAIASVALAYLFPGNILACHLEQQWQGFFQSKNAHAIRTIRIRINAADFVVFMTGRGHSKIATMVTTLVKCSLDTTAVA